MSKKVFKCLLCDQQAVVFVSFVQSDSLKKAHYCLQHAKEKGLLSAQGYQLLEGDLEVSTEKVVPPNTCPVCRYTQSMFIENKRMGCANCYRNFSSLVQRLLDRIYEEPVHLGKVPNRYLKTEHLSKRISYLKSKMNGVLLHENYEQAAIIRDKIRQLNSLPSKTHTKNQKRKT